MATLRKSTLPDDLRNGLRAYITSRSGLYFRDHDLGNLDGALGERMTAHGFESAFSYYNFLTASEKREEELRELLNLLTINHTYFSKAGPGAKGTRGDRVCIGQVTLARADLYC